MATNQGAAVSNNLSFPQLLKIISDAKAGSLVPLSTAAIFDELGDSATVSRDLLT